MFKTKLAMLATAGALLTSAASAMPLGNLSESAQGDQAIQQVRLVCDENGRCWRTSRRAVRSYYRPSYSPSYSYGPRYGYGSPYESRGYYGSPGVGFNFRF